VTDPGELHHRLDTSPEGRALLGEVGPFLDRFGFLGSNGSDFTASTWAEIRQWSGAPLAEPQRAPMPSPQG
jgi:hypothetical protein